MKVLSHWNFPGLKIIFSRSKNKCKCFKNPYCSHTTTQTYNKNTQWEWYLAEKYLRFCIFINLFIDIQSNIDSTYTFNWLLETEICFKTTTSQTCSKVLAILDISTMYQLDNSWIFKRTLLSTDGQIDARNKITTARETKCNSETLIYLNFVSS